MPDPHRDSLRRTMHSFASAESSLKWRTRRENFLTDMRRAERCARLVDVIKPQHRTSGRFGCQQALDMTHLPAKVMCRWFYLSLYSRKIVGAEVHEPDDADHAVHLVRRTALAARIATLETKPLLHGDNGSTLNAKTELAMLQCLAVKPSYSRPRVSDDNAYAESLFHTAKCRPDFPAKGFASLDDALVWATEFVRWYDVDHRHSGIRYVSPQQRHTGGDQVILAAARHALYSQAQQRNAARWAGKTRDWS